MNVTVFGAGYVGLVQAATLAEVGHRVTCVDVDQHKVERLTQGEIPIFEPGLSEIIKETVGNNRLVFTTNAKTAIESSDVIFIAVGTPQDKDGSADMQYVLKVAETIGEFATGNTIVVTKSTVPVGTSDLVKQALYDAAKEKNSNPLPLECFHVLSNPEFLKEGSAVSDCKRPDRIIIGGDSESAINTLKELYGPFNRNHDRIQVMDTRSAELTKYAANCMLATKISFMNEMSRIAEAVGADIEKVRVGIGSDPRIGFGFIYPGCGYGGSCFPKDVLALIKKSEEVNVPAKILRSVHDVNATQKNRLFEHLMAHYQIDPDSSGSLSDKSFAVWGLSFKPNTDDMREAPSINIIQALLARGATIHAHDPEAMDEARRIFGEHEKMVYHHSPEACLEYVDGLIIPTEWETFRSPDLNMLKTQLRDRVIFDGRNLYNPETLERHGLHYYGIGRGLSLEQGR